jgi:hypothetical protein
LKKELEMENKIYVIDDEASIQLDQIILIKRHAFPDNDGALIIYNGRAHIQDTVGDKVAVNILNAMNQENFNCGIAMVLVGIFTPILLFISILIIKLLLR